ncbi:MAG: GNAT family N-acetyltransferase [Prochlorotrichaceae cyanobacterium]
MNTDLYWQRTPLGSGAIRPYHWCSPLGTFQVRRATIGDLPALTQILSQAFHSDRTRQQWFYPLLHWGMKTDLKQRLTIGVPQHICLVAETEGRIHGTVELGTRPLIPWQPLAPETPRSSPHYLYLSNLAVLEYSRRQGIATHLIQACEMITQTWGFTGLYLHVLKNNQRACNLYCRAGYQIIQEEAPWEAWLLGRPPCLFLHKAV